jgi:hypothetical protein
MGEQLCYLYLNANDSKRELNVNKNNPDNNWNKSVVFLAVPASFSKFSPGKYSPGSLVFINNSGCLLAPTAQHFAHFHQRQGH